ncbi:hypothetical protein [uncultured Tateyamaria sp.]|uniref:hypothetical protein n=1 Tax=uncultured Tateyamaria sp. TaxID=455651 RepID=UPI0026069D1C|nr:hypothetical protein [uncultured Tateyamaria sp.]
MSKRTLFLHIGAQRTATTSIQSFMHANIDALMPLGIFYPLRVARHIEVMDQMMPRHPDGRPRPGVPARAPSDVAAEITRLADKKQHPLDRVVLSDEGLSLRRDLKALVPLNDHFDVKVIFFLRRQDLWLESWYFQNIKWQWNRALAHLTFNQFLAGMEQFHWIDYDRHVTMLENCFGAENVHLAVFEPGQMPDGPVVEFCRLIGLNDLTGLAQPSHENASLSPTMVEFLRHLPLDQANDGVRDSILAACRHVDSVVLGNDQRSSERILGLQDRQKLLNLFEASNRRLARRYFNRDALFQEPLPGADVPLAKLRLPDNSAELMGQLVGPLFEQLIATQTLQRPAGK